METFTKYAFLDRNNIVVNCIVVVGILTEIGSSLEPYGIIEYGSENSLTLNEASIGYGLDENLNAFIPPQPDPTYLLDQTSWSWKPDPSLEYDLKNDGKMYRYDDENMCWIPTWENNNI